MRTKFSANTVRASSLRYLSFRHGNGSACQIKDLERHRPRATFLVRGRQGLPTTSFSDSQKSEILAETHVSRRRGAFYMLPRQKPDAPYHIRTNHRGRIWNPPLPMLILAYTYAANAA